MKIYVVCGDGDNEFESIELDKEKAIQIAKSVGGYVMMYNINKEENTIEYEDDVYPQIEK